MARSSRSWTLPSPLSPCAATHNAIVAVATETYDVLRWNFSLTLLSNACEHESLESNQRYRAAVATVLGGNANAP